MLPARRCPLMRTHPSIRRGASFTTGRGTSRGSAIGPTRPNLSALANSESTQPSIDPENQRAPATRYLTRPMSAYAPSSGGRRTPKAYPCNNPMKNTSAYVFLRPLGGVRLSASQPPLCLYLGRPLESATRALRVGTSTRTLAGTTTRSSATFVDYTGIIAERESRRAGCLRTAPAIYLGGADPTKLS
jgi:hypothetical protein